jgi:membrane-associated phospholipid phosphatase/serine/threonine-protein kinase RIO1
MDVPADQSIPESTSPGRASTRIRWSRPRRRPSGEPPPLPYHLQTSGLGWLIATAALVALTTMVFAHGLRGLAVDVTVADDAIVRWLAGLNGPGLLGVWRALAAISSWVTIVLLEWGLLLALLALRRIRHLILFVILANVVLLITDRGVAAIAERPRPFGVVIRAGRGGWALPSLQISLIAFLLVVILYTLVPEGRWRNLGKWVAAGLVALTALGRASLGAEAPTDVLVGAALGVTLPLLAFRRFAPSEAFPVTYRRGRSAHLDISGRRGAAIRHAVKDQLGVVVLDVEPFGQQFSASSSPLRIKVQGNSGATYLFAKLYAISHLRADRWYKLGRELLYGRLEDEKPFNSIRRLVEHEDYALRLLRDRGLPVPTPFGSVELTPEREYLLVTEFLEGAKEISEIEVDDVIIDEGLAIIRRLWDAGLAHRDIKPANLLVQDGHVRLIDTFLTEVHATPWRQAVDLANMMLVLALGSDPARVYQRARQFFTDSDIGEAFAARQGRAMPSQVRQLLILRSFDLPAKFARLLPTPPRPFRMQRWTIRRVGLWALTLALLVLIGDLIVISVGPTLGVATPIHVSSLGCTHMEPLWLEAQSVPSASLVPCIRALPVGWTLTEVAVNDGRLEINFDHDRAGVGAAVMRLTAACEPVGAVKLPVTKPPVRQRYQRIEPRTDGFMAMTLYERFPGGCVTTRLKARASYLAQLTSEASLALGFTTRQELRQVLNTRSGGRLRLDPGTAP